MIPSRRLRQPAKLLHLRWTSYAIAAGATAAGTSPTVEAEIHYSGPVNYSFKGSSTFATYRFPLSNGVSLSAVLNKVFIGYDSAGIGVDGAQVSNSMRGPEPSVSSRFSLLSALPGRSVVSQGRFFPTPPIGYGLMQNHWCDNPDWKERGTYYAGFRFNNGPGPQYGWVRVQWAGCPRNYFIVKDYAWGDPGDQVKAGQKKLNRNEAAAPIIDAQGSLGLLALGAIGLQAWRAKRSE